jgi:hypothetical protein
MAMDFHSDRKVILSEASEYKSLYEWFVLELGDDKRKEGRPLIPWNWSLYFIATDIKLSHNVKSSDRYTRTEDVEIVEVEEHAIITATLTPSKGRRWRPTTYSMFGTDRHITDFTVTVYLAADGEKEGCSVWGCPSYTAEIDFRNETTPDVICFYMTLRRDKFERLARMVTDRSIDQAALRVGGVSGFYSDWSPEISTDFIKVLTPDTKSHRVEIPEGATITPPRLGEVHKFEFYTTCETKFRPPPDEIDEDQPADLHAAGPQTPSPKLMPVADPAALKLLKSLRVAAWIIAALLLAILLKSHSS